MKIIADCYDIQHLDDYLNCGIDRLILSPPTTSIRPVRVFDMSEIKNMILSIHEKQLEVGFNMLNFMMEETIGEFQDQLLFAKKMQVDAIYFSDMGVYQLAKEIQMENKLIYQPSTLITNSNDASHYLSLGLKNVVLSREITFDDLKRITQKCGGEVVVFGRNPMMHSRRRLLSSYFEFIHQKDQSDEENLYLMEENRDEKMPVFQDETGTHVLSGSTFCLFKEVDQLKNCDFKIEGKGIDEEMMIQASYDLHQILDHTINGIEMFEQYQRKYPKYNINDGFMYKKTSLVKEVL